MLGVWVAVVTAVMGSSGSGDNDDDNGIIRSKVVVALSLIVCYGGGDCFWLWSK